MNDQNHNLRSQRVNWAFWGVGLGSLVWLLLRSGTKLRRLTYPCQRAALVSSLGFLGYLLSLLGTVDLYRRLKRKATLTGVLLFVLALLVTSGLQGSSVVPPGTARASLPLPTWTSPGAISDVFVVPNVPVPPCSLDGGALPATPPCNDPETALHDDGVDALVDLMESQGTYFYQTTAHPDGIVGANDVVVIKINNQWGHMGYANGRGRLATNNDVLKGLIWRILQHPEGFGGEGLSMWLRIETGEEVSVLLFSGEPQAATPFEAWFEISPEDADPSGWILIELPWDHFSRADWADEGGLFELDLSRMVGIGLSFATPDDSQAESSVWVDDVRLLSESPQPAPTEAAPPAPATPTTPPPATATPTATAAPVAAALTLEAPTTPSPPPPTPPEKEGESRGLCPISIGLALAGLVLAGKGMAKPK